MVFPAFLLKTIDIYHQQVAMDHLSSLLAFGQWLVIMIANKAKDFACMSKKICHVETSG